MTESRFYEFNFVFGGKWIVNKLASNGEDLKELHRDDELRKCLDADAKPIRGTFVGSDFWLTGARENVTYEEATLFATHDYAGQYLCGHKTMYARQYSQEKYDFTRMEHCIEHRYSFAERFKRERRAFEEREREKRERK